MAHLAARLASLKPFSSRPGADGDDAAAAAAADDDDDDRGEQMGPDSVGASGRHDGGSAPVLRVSRALRAFLVQEGVLSAADAGLSEDDDDAVPSAALRRLMGSAAFDAPAHLVDASHPLPAYFVSSSHNTYLEAHQLYGASSTGAYEWALRTGSRCVEMDAWDDAADADEPKVTHGYTLVSPVAFRAVCETLRRVLDDEAAAGEPPAPVLLSLENHCGAHGQRRLVRIMRDVLGERLLSEAVRAVAGPEEEQQHDADAEAHVALAELGARVAVIVEHHPEDAGAGGAGESRSYSGSGPGPGPGPAPPGRNDDKDDDDDDNGPAATATIVPELAALGIYAQSVKPRDGSWLDELGGGLAHAPHHHLINVSESGLAKHLPGQAEAVARHNARHLMRVYPRGTRISSSNLKPVAFWAVGAQICALNWQTFGTSNQLNDALFSGSRGYVLKPAALRAGGSGRVGTGRWRRLRLDVAGASDVPGGRDGGSLRPYLTCNVYSACGVGGGAAPHKRKTAAYEYKSKKHGAATDPVWHETLAWEYEDNELVFVRMLVKSDDAWARNPVLAVAAVRLLYVEPGAGWRFVRMLDMAGRETGCTLLVRFTMEDA